MKEIYDIERELKIGLTDSDFEDYQDGNLSDDFYARRKDGSIANRVDISPLNYNSDNLENNTSSSDLDPVSALIGVAFSAAFFGICCGIKKLWNRHKTKKANESMGVNQRIHDNHQMDISTHNFDELEKCKIYTNEVDAIDIDSTSISNVTMKADNDHQKQLTDEKVIQELMKIIVGMAEMIDGGNKITEGVKNLTNVELVDKKALLEILSDQKVLDIFNSYLCDNPQLVDQKQKTFINLFGRNLFENGWYVPLNGYEIEQQLEKIL